MFRQSRQSQSSWQAEGLVRFTPMRRNLQSSYRRQSASNGFGENKPNKRHRGGKTFVWRRRWSVGWWWPAIKSRHGPKKHRNRGCNSHVRVPTARQRCGQQHINTVPTAWEQHLHYCHHRHWRRRWSFTTTMIMLYYHALWMEMLL